MGSFPKLCLRWNNHVANLLDTLDSLLSSQQHSDVTLACQGSVWHLHRLVLSASSTHFAGLLAEVAPGQLPLIIVDGPSKQDIAALICFIYHGEVSVDQDHLPELLKTASALKIKGLAEFPIDGPPSCQAIVRSAPVQVALTSHPSYEVAAEHKKLKSVETSDYASDQMTSTAHVAEPQREQDELDDEPEEVLPLNLSCKRDSYGDSRRSNSESQNVLDDSCYEQRSISYSNHSSSVLPDVAHPEPPQTPVGTGPHIIHDHSRDSPSSSSFYKYVSISSSVPLTLDSKACYVVADIVDKPDITCSTTVPLYPPVSNRPINADQVSSSWMPSKGVIREARPLLLSDGGSNVYHVPPTYSVIMPSSSNPANIQNQQLQEVNPSPLILPQPPMKRLRTVEPVSHIIAGIKDPTEHPMSTHVSMVGISVPVPSSMSQGNSCVQPSSIYTTELNPHVRTPTKKYQEVINVCPPQVIKSVETTREVKVSSYETHSKPSAIPCIPKYKFIPVKTEAFLLSDDGCGEPSEASNRVCNTKLGCNIKQETPMKLPSPLQTTETLKDPTLPPNPILSSAFLSTKNIAPSSMHSIVIPKSSPIKCSASPQPPLPSGSSCQVSPQVSPVSSNQQQTLLPSSFNTSPQILEQKPVLKSLIESEGIASNLASDEVPSQSAPANNTEDCEVSSIHSNTSYYASSPTCSVQTATSGANTMSSSVTTTSSTPPASGGTATTTTSTEAATGSSSQRVSINMRTFKEEWRRQLLVDYDSRTNMSICMLCFTTFKSYDGPRKNTYVKHAKRFHTVLDDYTEEERDMIIKNYEHQYKYDPDMQKEVNKSFKCSGGGPWGGRGGGKVCRSGSLPGAAAHASSGSSTGSSSQPGSRPDTDGEDDHHPQHLLGRCESPDSDGSIEARDTVSLGPPSGGGDAAASTTSTVSTGPMVSVTGGTATGCSQLTSMVITPHMTSHGTTHTSSSVDRLHPGSSASVFSIAGPSQSVMTKAPVYEESTHVATQSFSPLLTLSAHTSTGNLTVSGHSSSLTTSVHTTSTSSSLATIPSSSSSTLVFTNLVPGSSSASRPSYLFTTQGAPLSAYPLSTPRLPFSNELKHSPSNNNNISINNKNNCSLSTTEKVEARLRNKYYPSQSFVHTTSSPTVSLARTGGTSVSSTVACGAMVRSNASVSAGPTNTSTSSAVVVGTLSNTPQRSTGATCPNSSSAVSPGDSTISVTVPAV